MNRCSSGNNDKREHGNDASRLIFVGHISGEDRAPGTTRRLALGPIRERGWVRLSWGRLG